MKKFLEVLLLFGLLWITITYREDIQYFLAKLFVFRDEVYIQEKNEYYLASPSQYIKETNDFVVKDRQDLFEVIYTFLNNGWDEFSFYCQYKECRKDIDEISNSDEPLILNNFIHPFNTYNHLYMSTNSFNRVTLSLDKAYSETNIEIVNKNIDEIIKKIISDDMTLREKIKTFHDYIIDNTTYDSAYINSNLNDLSNPSHIAIGPLVYKRALCGGYTDVMAIFLNKIGVPNYKVSNDSHIWNLVYLDNNWYHLDLTWDDPVIKKGDEVILDTFFLITTEQLEELNTGYHNYDKNIFIEAN